MKRKILFLLVVFTYCISLVTGCGRKDSSTDVSKEEKETCEPIASYDTFYLEGKK